jgi:hypothetical protein
VSESKLFLGGGGDYIALFVHEEEKHFFARERQVSVGGGE